LYTAFLLASKFWEDQPVYNEDYANPLKYFSLYSTIKLESSFLGLCNYEIFVTVEMYTKYFFEMQRQSMRDLNIVIDIVNPDLKQELLRCSKCHPS